MLLGLKEEGVLEVPEDIVKAGASFGGGMALSKNVCGSLSAAALAVGLKFGTTEPTGRAPEHAYARTKAIMDRFKARFGSTQCGDLTGQFKDFGSRERAYMCGVFVDFISREIKDVLEAEEELPEWREDWWDDYLNRRDKIT